MKRRRRIFLYILLSGVLLFLVCGCLAYLFRNDIKRMAVEKLNTVLTTPVSVEDIALDPFSHFPYVSVTLKKLSFSESAKVNDKAVATAEKLSLTINIWNALTKNIRFHTLILEDAEILASVAKDSTRNFEIFKGGSKDSSSNGTELTFKKIVLNNCRFTYTDVPGKLTMHYAIDELLLSGNFGSDNFELDIAGTFYSDLKIGEQQWLRQRFLELDTRIFVDLKANQLHLDETSFSIDGIGFLAKGQIALGGKSETELNIRGKDLQVTHLVNILPAEYRQQAADYKGSGELTFSGDISHKPGEEINIRAKFTVNQGTLHLSELEKGLRSINLDGELNIKGDKQSLRFRKFSLKLLDDPINGQFELRDFKDPFIDGSFKGKIQMANLRNIIKLPATDSLDGELSFDLNLRNRIKSLLNKEELAGTHFSGNVKGKGITYLSSAKAQEIRNLDMDIALNPVFTDVKLLRGSWQSLDFDIQGNAENLLGYLFKKEQLWIEGRLRGNNWTLASPKQQPQEKSPDTSSFAFPDRISLRLNIELRKLGFGRFNAEDVIGDISLDEKVVSVHNLRLSTCDGSLKIRGKFSRLSTDQYRLMARATVHKVNIKKAFYQFNNFGQSSLTDANIDGNLTGEFDLAMLWDKNFNLVPSSLYAYNKFRIEKGRLVNYDPLKALSRFISVEELENVQFATLENEIEIGNEKIFIPRMEIKNNALNLSVEGEHSFANMMNYSIRVNLSQMLAKSHSEKLEEDNFEKTPEGINIFLRMQGPASDPSFSYDRKKARENLKDQVKTEKETIRDLFKNELGIKPAKKSNSPVKQEDSWEEDIPE